MTPRTINFIIKMGKEIKIRAVRLDSKVIRKLRDSDLTVGDFAKRYGMKRRSK